MTTEEAFLADIREHPDDDAPRLIFADWLEDNGQAERAELIRLMLQIAARLEDDPGGLRDRAGQLLVRNWQRWVGPLRNVLTLAPYEPWLTGPPSPSAICNYPRGFIARLTLDSPCFVRHAEAIHRLTPLTSLSLRRAGTNGADLADCAGLRWIRRLSFVDYYSYPLDATDAAALARSPYLTRLQQLTLFRNNLGDLGVRALAEAPWLRGLMALDLTENGLSSLGARFLAESPHLGPLRHLALSMNSIGDEGVASLCRAGWLPGLATLGIDRAGVTPRGLAMLRERAPSVRLFHDTRLS